MLRGLATVNIWATDEEAAARWYAELLGIDPNFRRPEEGPPTYLKFWIGDYRHELGVIDGRLAPGVAAPGPGGATAYWHVDDVRAAFDRLLSMGARTRARPSAAGGSSRPRSSIPSGTCWA